MGRKVGKKRSKALDSRLSSMHFGFSCLLDALLLTPYQWKNYLSSKRANNKAEVR